MTTETIHIVINEPTTDDGVGSFEWRIDRKEAEREFRSLRGNESATYLYTDVTVPEHLREDFEQIAEWVDSIYCDYSDDAQQMSNAFGTEPTRVHLR